ncbi:ABC transporter permease [Pseudoalteromonas luteoviolacea]|uniref:ABC transporter permease n=1 Tax=Pseudoalteromonas luteoviolacea TaxID=43657 RepID=UPI001F3885EE|nr:ABC transporter permease [Pseudoalteromonas luteoviolacea]MCF6439133.1 ABC transporter permease [Pseudoalteromonas luteoviolacea]
MGHSRTSFFFQEAANEAKLGLKSLITPIVFFGLTAYMLIFLLNADYMRSMGAVDIYRNSPHVIYLMVSGQSLWLFFAWAWIFAQIVVRDRSAELHEVVLASPISLRLLLAARFSGALVVAVILGSSICVGLLMAPILVTFGALPPDAVGPVPWAAAAASLLVFTIPSAFATGVLFLAGASLTRSNTGAFATAAILSLIWMIGLVVLHEGGVSPMLASIIDPSAYVEAERQALIWTPAEKKVAMIGLTDMLLINRGLWLSVGVIVGGILLVRLRREHLAMERAPRAQARKGASVSKYLAAPAGLIVNPNWWRTLVVECTWHLKISLQSFGLRLALLLLTAIGVAAAWVNSIGHIDGPLVPTPQALIYFMVGFFFVFIVFVVVGFVGALMRRDDCDGFIEWLDTSPVPLGTRLFARFIAALGLTALLCLVPAVASVLMTAIAAPHALDIIYPFAYVLLTVFPALAELCAIAVLAHAIFQRAGTAYVVSILAAFIAIVNHEVELVQYTPAAIGTPIHAYPSELAGWSPWIAMIVALASLKLSLAFLLFSGSWLAWRRGTALTLRDRINEAKRRVVGTAGMAATAALSLVFVCIAVLNTRFVNEGGYASSMDALAHDGNWEKKWWKQASPYSISGGEVLIRLNPANGTGDVNWRLEGVRAQRLHGTLPHGVELVGATRKGMSLDFAVDSEHFVVEAGCLVNCELTLELNIGAQGWQTEAAPWLDTASVWLRAHDVLPVLGHDPQRLVRSIGDRPLLGLPTQLPAIPQAAALASLEGVAPMGDWTWSVAIDSGSGEYQVFDKGDIEGVLAFASIWQRDGSSTHQQSGVEFLVGDARQPLVDGFAQELVSLQQCVESELGGTSPINTVVQAPRKSGEIALYNGVLWAPEDIAWQSDGTGRGAWQRQYNLAAALARDAIGRRGELRDEAGARWFIEGVAGWTALRCVEIQSGFDAAIAVRKRASEQLAEEFATTDKPITKAMDGDISWLGLYAALSLDSWGASEYRTPSSMMTVFEGIDSGDLLSRLSKTVGNDSLELLIGAPRSSDVAIKNNDTGVEVSVLSWVWKEGGWQAQPALQRLLLRGSDMHMQEYMPQSLAQRGVELDGSYLFYAGIGYERSIDDNRFQNKCADTKENSKCGSVSITRNANDQFSKQ